MSLTPPTESSPPAVPAGLFPGPLPTAVPKVQPSPARAPDRPDPTQQLSLFGVAAVEPSPADLAGLLAGPGEVVRMGGTARVSILVDEAWRVHVLITELARRGVPATWVTSPAGGYAVRTAYTAVLAPLARSWLREGVKRVPDDFHMAGARLRLWVAASGTVESTGSVLRPDPSDEVGWARLGAALSGVGLSGVPLESGPGGPAYRVVGRRRLARLAELVGDRPPAVPPGRWPGRWVIGGPPTPIAPSVSDLGHPSAAQDVKVDGPGGGDA